MGEVVCVAGFRYSDLHMGIPDWIRLFPFHVRDLPRDLRVHKWDIVKLQARRSTNDKRPESLTPHMHSIQVVGHMETERNWQERRRFVDPHRGRTMRDLLASHEQLDTSLAVVEPGEILDVEVTRRSEKDLQAARRKAEAEVAQGDLFSLEDRQPLEPTPFDFHLVFRCTDDTEPRRLKIIDWEIGQAFRKYRASYPNPEQIVRERWLNDVCGPRRDPALFVGNQKRFPVSGSCWGSSGRNSGEGSPKRLRTQCYKASEGSAGYSSCSCSMMQRR